MYFTQLLSYMHESLSFHKHTQNRINKATNMCFLLENNCQEKVCRTIAADETKVGGKLRLMVLPKQAYARQSNAAKEPHACWLRKQCPDACVFFICILLIFYKK